MVYTCSGLINVRTTLQGTKQHTDFSPAQEVPQLPVIVLKTSNFINSFCEVLYSTEHQLNINYWVKQSVSLMKNL